MDFPFPPVLETNVQPILDGQTNSTHQNGHNCSGQK